MGGITRRVESGEAYAEMYPPIQRSIQHLSPICTKISTQVSQQSIVKEVRKVHKSLSQSVDEHHITRRMCAEYHDVILEGSRLWAMWDSGTLFYLMTVPLAHELGLQWSS